MKPAMNEVILKTEFWTVKLFPDQAYLGRCIILSNRDCGELSNLTSEEFSDFYEIVKKLENGLKKAFNATMFNWTCLMNNAYKQENPQPHVHWHFRPRYKEKVEFENEVFEDTEFAHHYDRARRKIISSELLKKIADKIREKL